MNWLLDLFRYKVCLTRVLERDHIYLAQVRFAFIWFTLSTELKADYDYGAEYEEDRRRLERLREFAQEYAAAYHGHYIGTVKYESLRDKINSKLRAKFTGPCGMQGAMGQPGLEGQEGRRGPAFDDIECPHCKTRRSDIHPPVALHFDYFGDDLPLTYTCKFFKCGRQSNWIAYNGIFINESTITVHDTGDNKGPTSTDRAVP